MGFKKSSLCQQIWMILVVVREVWFARVVPPRFLEQNDDTQEWVFRKILSHLSKQLWHHPFALSDGRPVVLGLKLRRWVLVDNMHVTSGGIGVATSLSTNGSILTADLGVAVLGTEKLLETLQQPTKHDSHSFLKGAKSSGPGLAEGRISECEVVTLYADSEMVKRENHPPRRGTVS
jgi:hypothetical protein